MKYPKADRYAIQFVRDNMMGPNALKLLEEMGADLHLRPGERVMDLGCGRGLTSIFLVKEYGCEVFAVDLWTAPEENYQRFQEMKVDHMAFPINADIRSLPFAKQYFDAVISVDAYHYFGRDAEFIDRYIAPYIVQDGLFSFCVPGFVEDFEEIYPYELLESWSTEDLAAFQSLNWWKALAEQSKHLKLIDIQEMQSFDDCWADWLATDNEYARNDCKAMNAGAGAYMNFIMVTLKKL